MEDTVDNSDQVPRKSVFGAVLRKLLIIQFIILQIQMMIVGARVEREETARKYRTFEDVHELMHLGKLGIVIVNGGELRYEITHNNSTITFARIEHGDTLSFSVSGIPDAANPILLRASGNPAYETRIIPGIGDGLKNVEPEFLRVALGVKAELAKRYSNQPQSSLVPQSNNRNWMMSRPANFARPSAAKFTGVPRHIPQKV